MRTIKILGGAILLACILGLCCGCLSATDQARMNELAAKVVALEAESTTIVEKVKNGSLTVSDGLAYVQLIHAQVTATKDEITGLKQKGYGKWEIVGSVLLGLLGAVGGIKGLPAKVVDPLLRGPWDK